MTKAIVGVVATVLVIGPASGSAQNAKPDAATYITKEEVDTVNKLPGIDRTVRVVDIGDQHFAVGVIHRGASGSTPPRPPTPTEGTQPCGVAVPNPPPGLPAGLTHDKQTEGYYIISGEGTLVTGGHIVNGRTEPPTAEVVTTLNGPSCRGGISGPDVVKGVVKAGDIVIIPPNVPHGWMEIKDHVDYVSFRPSGDTLTAGYVHPSIKK